MPTLQQTPSREFLLSGQTPPERFQISAAESHVAGQRDFERVFIDRIQATSRCNGGGQHRRCIKHAAVVLLGDAFLVNHSGLILLSVFHAALPPSDASNG